MFIFICLWDFWSQADSHPNEFEFVIVSDKKPYTVQVTRKEAQYEITINGQDTITIDDTFQLSDEVLDIKLNKDQNLTLQLVSKEHNGNINLQYLGTKVTNENPKTKKKIYLTNFWFFDLSTTCKCSIRQPTSITNTCRRRNTLTWAHRWSRPCRALSNRWPSRSDRWWMMAPRFAWSRPWRCKINLLPLEPEK